MGRTARRWAIGATATVLMAGTAGAWVVGANTRSPQQAAAHAAPPEPSAITAPVERRVLSATVITRADVAPAGSVAIGAPATDEGSSGEVVTGVFVARGDEVAPGARVIEVAGRPVFVLAGSTPAYRTLRPQLSGRDVEQLQAGLAALGCDLPATGTFDDATKACVERLYADAGYTTMRSSPTEAADLAGAQSAVDDAEDALAVAQLTLWNASRPPAGSAVAAARNAVNDAKRTYDAAAAAGQDTGPASEALGVARAALAELTAPPDTAMQQLAVEQQQRAVDRAHTALADLQAASGPVVPFGEIVFVPELPGRVDSVTAVVGQAPDATSPLLVVATPQLEAHVGIPQSDRALVQEGTPVDLLDEATGETVTGTVRTIGSELEPSATSVIPSYPAVVDAELPATWSGRNLRATFTSATTATAVLVVPLAAVTSSADGTTRVEVDGGDGGVRTVAVTTGLSADGFVEVTPVAPDVLDTDDRVIVG